MDVRTWLLRTKRAFLLFRTSHAGTSCSEWFVCKAIAQVTEEEFETAPYRTSFQARHDLLCKIFCSQRGYGLIHYGGVIFLKVEKCAPSIGGGSELKSPNDYCTTINSLLRLWNIIRTRSLSLSQKENPLWYSVLASDASGTQPCDYRNLGSLRVDTKFRNAGWNTRFLYRDLSSLISEWQKTFLYKKVLSL